MEGKSRDQSDELLDAESPLRNAHMPDKGLRRLAGYRAITQRTPVGPAATSPRKRGTEPKDIEPAPEWCAVTSYFHQV
jgi:hypothetical protein